MKRSADVGLGRLPLLGRDAVAAWLGISFDTIYRLSRAGQLPAVKIGGSWRFRPADVDAYLDQQLAEQRARQAD